jgi:hypothetical protein
MGYSKLLFFFLILSTFFLFSCEKIYDDKIPPIIILIGDNPATVLLGCTYEDPGYLVKDDNSDTSVTVSGNINTDSAGVYLLNYIASDDDDNQSNITRKVIVRPFDFDLFEGTFNVTDTIIAIPKQVVTYQVAISLFNQTPRMLKINNFNNFGDEFGVIFQPDSSGVFQIDYNRNDTIIQGNGQINCTNGGFRINYYVQADSIYPFQHKATFKK